MQAEPTTAEEAIFVPQPAQARFLASGADIAIFGGGAGSGKSWSLLIEPLRHVDNKRFGAVIFRRTYPEITNEGGLWDESRLLYPEFGAVPNRSELFWTFPSGCSVSFSHLQSDNSVHLFQGAQIPLVCFDELTHFSQHQFFYLLSRNRSTSGIAPYIRATTNADADSWVARFIDWWIGEDGFPIPERGGQIRYFVRLGDGGLDWASSRAELTDRHGPEFMPKSVAFFPALLSDNPALLSKDPGYKANLLALPRVERERLLLGNWKTRPTAGKVFNRASLGVVEAVPAGGLEVLFWDFAATEKELRKTDPDYTACVGLRAVRGRFYVAYMDAFQVGPAEVERRFVNLSQQRAAYCEQTGTRLVVRWELERGGAGKREGARYAALLAGLDCKAVLPHGDKILRAAPFAAQCDAGNVSILAAAWTERFLSELHGFPDAAHDDVVDAASGALTELAGLRRAPQEARSYQG